MHIPYGEGRTAYIVTILWVVGMKKGESGNILKRMKSRGNKNKKET